MGPNTLESRTWPFKITWRHRSRATIFNRFQDICIQIYLGHDLDLSSSRDVIMQSRRFAICHFLLVSHWNWVSIFNRFRDVCIQIYLGHDLHLSGPRDVTGLVTLITQVPFPIGALL